MIKHKILCYEQFDHLFLFMMLDVNKCFIAQIQQTQNSQVSLWVYLLCLWLFSHFSHSDSDCWCLSWCLKRTSLCVFVPEVIQQLSSDMCLWFKVPVVCWRHTHHWRCGIFSVCGWKSLWWRCLCLCLARKLSWCIGRCCQLPCDLCLISLSHVKWFLLPHSDF